MSRNSGKSNLNGIVSQIFIFFSILYIFASSPNNIYYTDVGQLRIDVAQSIVENFDIVVSEDSGIRGYDGRYYSLFGIGSVLLAVPLYSLERIIGLPRGSLFYLISPLITAAIVSFIFLFTNYLGYSRRSSILVSFCYGLGTFAWPLGKQPFDHPLESFFVLSATYYLYRFINSKRNIHLLLSASLTGFAFLTRSTSILVIPAFFMLALVWFIQKHDVTSSIHAIGKNTVIFLLTFLPFLCLGLSYNYFRFGSVFETGYSLISESSGVDFFSAKYFMTGFCGLLLSPGKGFFFYSPIAILFLFSIIPFFKRHLAVAICFNLIILIYTIFFSIYVYWHGDWAWGPRYLLVITPFLMIPVAELFDSIVWNKNMFLKVFVYSLFAVSLTVQLAAISVDFQKYFFYLRDVEYVVFTKDIGEGVQPVVEPPNDVYFELKKSPILMQFKFIKEIGSKFNDYRKDITNPESSSSENMEITLQWNLFDFWFVKAFILDRNSTVFLILSFFVLLFLSARNMFKYLSAKGD